MRKILIAVIAAIAAFSILSCELASSATTTSSTSASTSDATTTSVSGTTDTTTISTTTTPTTTTPTTTTETTTTPTTSTQTTFLTDEQAVSYEGSYCDELVVDTAYVETLLDSMTLAEKAGQMLQAERNGASTSDVRTYNLGSVLSGGGSSPSTNLAYEWYLMYENFQNAA
ncbi:MAG: hypothetical protein Q8N15_07900, partial [Bacillota bacterium]|nr:hypothetical protein [Bacillota bacterium]